MKKNHDIRFKVSQEELNLIEKKAKKLGMSLGQFCRYLALNVHPNVVLEED